MVKYELFYQTLFSPIIYCALPRTRDKLPIWTLKAGYQDLALIPSITIIDIKKLNKKNKK